MTLHGAYEGPCHETDLAKVLGAFDGVDGDTIMTVPSRGLSVKITGVVDVLTPEFTCFVPSSV